jgi:hypothetical protein
MREEQKIVNEFTQLMHFQITRLETLNHSKFRFPNIRR